MEANSPAYYPVKHTTFTDPAKLGRGLLWLPVFLVNAFVPTLDGPRDLVSTFTQRPNGGGEGRVLAALERALPADAVISTGDVVRDGRRGRLWEDWVRRVAPLRRAIPLFAAPGNHERTYEPEAERDWRAATGEAAEPGRLWYAVDVSECDARFLFLDSNVLTDAQDRRASALEDSLAEAQLAWAEAQLAAPHRFTFVVLHHPLLSAGHYTEDWGGAHDTPAARRRARLLALCARGRVTAVLAGHEHLYQRVRVRTPEGGFWHVTTAGGGAPLYPVEPAERDRELARPLPEGLAVERASLRAVRAYHYARLVLPPAGDRDGVARFDVFRVRGGGAVDSLDALRFEPSGSAR